MSERAVIVLGHGSRSTEATDQFLSLVETLVPHLPGIDVRAAFMELAAPSLEDAVAGAVEAGAGEIVVLPCFLFIGNHIKNDIPRKIERQAERFPDVRFEQREPIGPDPRIREVLLDRLGFSDGSEWAKLAPDEIEAASMRMIDNALVRFSDPRERAVARRLIHATGDLTLQEAVAFSPGAIDAALAAIGRGADVVTDVRMVEAGVDRRRLEAAGGKTVCRIDDEAVAESASAAGRTRAATAMRSLAEDIDGAIVAIGNAPTALREVIGMADEGVARPAVVVGTPVGFVDAAESKAALEASGLEYITVRRFRGGSPIAAAAVNALLRLDEEG